MASATKVGSAPPLGAADFRRRFRKLVSLCWLLPPVFNVLFILLIGVLSQEQVLSVLTNPLVPIYVFGWLGFALWLLPRCVHPLSDFLADPIAADRNEVLRSLRVFPYQFWMMFLVYLLFAPAALILGVEYATDFVAQPIHWYRIHLTALIVSSIIGLSIFFLMLELFGHAVADIELKRPYVTIKSKVFLIGVLVPLLLTSILVQYYWTRTGYFSLESFGVWLVLALLAIGVSLIFVRSMNRSLMPLQGILNHTQGLTPAVLATLSPRSTDELGLLSREYRILMEQLQLQNEMLEINNRLLRNTAKSSSFTEVVEEIISLSQEVINDDVIFLILHDPERNDLVGVAQTGAAYSSEGHYRIALNETSTAVWVFKHGETAVIPDAATDVRVSPKMRERFQVQSTLAAPLLVEGQTIGVLMSISKAMQHDYSAREISILETLARDVAMAVHIRQLYEQRVQAEVALRDNREVYRNLVESSQAIPWELDLKSWRFTYVGPQAVSILGYPITDWYKENFWQEHIYPDDRKEAMEYCQFHTDREQDHEFEYRMIAASGELVWIRDSVNIIRTGGKAEHLSGFMFDITEKRHAEQSLLESRRMLQMVLDTIPERVFWKDSKLNYLGCNRLFARDAGFESPQEIIGKSDYEMGWAEQAELYRSDDKKVIQAGQAKLGYEEPQTTPEGERIWLETSKIPLTDMNGETIGVLGTYHDITQRKLIEEELAQYRENLEDQVNRRTKELQRINQELESFSYSVSHDLRAPLRAIDGFSNALLEDFQDKLDMEGKDYLLRIRTGAQRMALLIDDLLQLSRVTRSEFKRGEVDLSIIADKVLDKLQQSAPERIVQRKIASNVLTDGDERLLYIVLENLLGNAWKYTGKLTMAEIEFGMYEEDGRSIYFVRDNGAGFDMQYAGKLFGAFQRLHRQDEFEGTGIGLATIQRIIHRHGGRIWAEAKPDEGAVFYFTLEPARNAMLSLDIAD